MQLRTICRKLSGFTDEMAPDLASQIAGAKRLGLDAIDVRFVDQINVCDLSPAQLKEVKDRAHDAGLGIASVGSPVNKCELTEEHRPVELDKMKRAVAAAQALGTDRIRIFSPTVQERFDKADWPRVRDWLGEQIDVAKGTEITLLHENDWVFWGAYPDGAKMILEEFSGPHFKAIYDFANAVWLGTRPMRDWFPWLLPYLDTLHIKDMIEDGKKIMPAGEGEGDIPATFEYLAKAGWSGTLTLEPHLIHAGHLAGFSGEELFGKAVSAVNGILDGEVSA